MWKRGFWTSDTPRKSMEAIFLKIQKIRQNHVWCVVWCALIQILLATTPFPEEELLFFVFQEDNEDLMWVHRVILTINISLSMMVISPFSTYTCALEPLELPENPCNSNWTHHPFLPLSLLLPTKTRAKQRMAPFSNIWSLGLNNWSPVDMYSSLSRRPMLSMISTIHETHVEGIHHPKFNTAPEKLPFFKGQ